MRSLRQRDCGFIWMLVILGMLSSLPSTVPCLAAEHLPSASEVLRRMPEGVWVNATQVLQIQCRKLTSTLRFRSTEESSEFKKVAAPR